MNICELTMSITALANSIASKLSTDKLNLLGAIFSQLGDTLNTIATQRSICEDINNTSSSDNSNDNNTKSK